MPSPVVMDIGGSSGWLAAILVRILILVTAFLFANGLPPGKGGDIDVSVDIPRVDTTVTPPNGG